MSVQVVWFKKDLRVADHAPLHEAALPVLPLYVYEPEQLHHEEFAGHHLAYLNDCLRELQQDLARLGAPLVIRHGEVTEVLERLSEEVGISGLWAHEETGNWVSFQRDLRVHRWARARGIPFAELPQNGVVRRMVNRDGWADTWEERLSAPQVPTPTALRGVRVASAGLLSHAELGVSPNDKEIPAGGRSVALATLDSFLTLRGVNFTKGFPSPSTQRTKWSAHIPLHGERSTPACTVTNGSHSGAGRCGCRTSPISQIHSAPPLTRAWSTRRSRSCWPRGYVVMGNSLLSCVAQLAITTSAQLTSFLLPLPCRKK